MIRCQIGVLLLVRYDQYIDTISTAYRKKENIGNQQLIRSRLVYLSYHTCIFIILTRFVKKNDIFFNIIFGIKVLGAPLSIPLNYLFNVINYIQ